MNCGNSRQTEFPQDGSFCDAASAYSTVTLAAREDAAPGSSAPADQGFGERLRLAATERTKSAVFGVQAAAGPGSALPLAMTRITK